MGDTCLRLIERDKAVIASPVDLTWANHLPLAALREPWHGPRLSSDVGEMQRQGALLLYERANKS